MNDKINEKKTEMNKMNQKTTKTTRYDPHPTKKRKKFERKRNIPLLRDET